MSAAIKINNYVYRQGGGGWLEKRFADSPL